MKEKVYKLPTRDLVKDKNRRKEDMNSSLPVSLKARSVKTSVFLLSRDNLTKSIFESVALLKKSPYRDITLLTSPVIKITVKICL